MKKQSPDKWTEVYDLIIEMGHSPQYAADHVMLWLKYNIVPDEPADPRPILAELGLRVIPLGDSR